MSDFASLPPARLVTVFGTVLYVDTASGELRHGPHGSSPANAAFVADPDWPGPPRRGRLMHDADGAREPIVCMAERSMCLSRSQSEGGSGAPTVLELIPLERGLIAFSAGDVFLSAHSDGTVRLCAPVCSTWELFLGSEDWCTDAREANYEVIGSTIGAKFNTKTIRNHIVHPTLRARANTKPKGAKIMIYGYTKWSHGRVYYDLCKHLHRRGYIADILDWQVSQAGHMAELRPYYDLFMASLDAVGSLVDVYGVPYDRIIAISHHELDIRMLIERKGIDVFDKFANYGVVNEFLYSASLMRGVARVPRVASLGINYADFHSDISERLQTVGYASFMSVKTYGIEWKRGELVEAAAREAGLAFKVAGSTENQISFHDMPEFYRSVDALVTSSVSESGPLPVLEAAAAGKLVIGTPVGHFPQMAYQGAGVMAPIEAEKFTAFTAATLLYYRDHPAAYRDKCRSIQEAARQADWQNVIETWIALIESATPPAINQDTVETGDYEFTSDWFSGYIQVWDQLIGHRLKPARILEIGSFEGRSTCYLIETCAKVQPVFMCCVDTWQGGIEHDKNAMPEIERRFDRNVMLAKQRAPHTVIVKKFRKSSIDALAEIIALRESPFDLVYIDGSHQAPDVLSDAILAFQLLRIGGIMIFDDYLWRLEPEGRQDSLNMPKPAIDSFINIFQRKLKIISGLPIYQLYVEKLFR